MERRVRGDGGSLEIKYKCWMEPRAINIAEGPLREKKDALLSRRVLLTLDIDILEPW